MNDKKIHRISKILVMCAVLVYAFACAESEDSTDDLLLGFLAGGSTSGTALWEARVADPDGSTDQVINTGTVTDLNWSFEVQDPGNLLNGTELIVAQSGTYQINADVTLNQIPDGSYVTCGLRREGVSTYVISHQLNSGTQEGYTCNFSQAVYLEAGASYRVLVAHNAGGDRNAARYSRFSGYRVQ